MSIILDTPEQMSMWVLLSRRAQLKLQLKGLPTKGLVAWCRKNIEGCENARTAKQCVIPVENAIVFAGGPQDFSIVNVHVMLNRGGMFFDQGVFNDMSEVEANASLVRAYRREALEIVYTLEDVREPNGQVYVSE